MDAADEADSGGGFSDLGVGKTRIVLGPVRFTGEPVEGIAGLDGCELAEASETARGFLAGVSGFVAVERAGDSFISLSDSLVAAAISSLPGG